MSDFLDRWKVQESRAALPGLAKRMQQLQADLSRQLAAARAYTDRDLSPEGLGKRRQQMADQARQRADQALTELTREMRQHVTRVREWAQARRPVIADDPVQLQKASLAWDRARAMLDAGRSIRQVLADATDPAMVLALREWGPDYLRAKMPAPAGLVDYGQPGPDFTGLVRSADQRLAELHGGDVAAAIDALRDADVAEAGFETRARHVGQQVAGGHIDAMAAAIEAHYAEAQAAAGWHDDAADGAGEGDAA